MTYTALSIAGTAVAVLIDVLVLRTRLVARRLFWVSEAIIVAFQLLSNGVLTGFAIVRYDGNAIIGDSTPITGAPPFLGHGRIAFAPVEDLLFGFALTLSTLALWVWWGARGLEREPVSGPVSPWVAQILRGRSAGR